MNIQLRETGVTNNRKSYEFGYESYKSTKILVN